MQGSPRQPSSAGEPTAAPLASSNSAGHGDRAQQPRQQPEGAHTAVPMPPEPPVPPFGVSRSQLFALNDAKDTDGLRALGGAPRLARLLLCDLKEGINGADADEEDRHGSGRHASSSLGKHAAKQGGAAADGVSGGVTMPAPSIAERVKVSTATPATPRPHLRHTSVTPSLPISARSTPPPPLHHPSAPPPPNISAARRPLPHPFIHIVTATQPLTRLSPCYNMSPRSLPLPLPLPHVPGSNFASSS